MVDVIVVLVLLGLLAAIWAPVISNTRNKSSQYRCMNHLHTIFQAMMNYKNNNGGRVPRTLYAKGAPPSLTSDGAAAMDPFKGGGPPANNVPAAMFLLLRTQNTHPRHFICPSGNYEPDDCGGGDPSLRSNFTDVKKNMGYSFFFPYTSRFSQPGGTGGFIVAADRNPGVKGDGDDVAGIKPGDPPETLRKGNSNNHAKHGQNVLLDDGHVEFVASPFVGNGDNIFATQNGSVSEAPADGDTLLLPTDD
jgi:type II secretory pathway pseudopilin PulG